MLTPCLLSCDPQRREQDDKSAAWRSVRAHERHLRTRCSHYRGALEHCGRPGAELFANGQEHVQHRRRRVLLDGGVIGRRVLHPPRLLLWERWPWPQREQLVLLLGHRGQPSQVQDVRLHVRHHALGLR